METPQVQRSCATSLEAISIVRSSRRFAVRRGIFESALIVSAHVFSWPCTRWGAQKRSLISSSSGRLATWSNQRSLLCTSSAGIYTKEGNNAAVPPLARYLCASHGEYVRCINNIFHLSNMTVICNLSWGPKSFPSRSIRWTYANSFPGRWKTPSIIS